MMVSGVEWRLDQRRSAREVMTPPSAEARMAPTGESNRHPTAAGLSPRAAEVTVRFAR